MWNLLHIAPDIANMHGTYREPCVSWSAEVKSSGVKCQNANEFKVAKFLNFFLNRMRKKMLYNFLEWIF